MSSIGNGGSSAFFFLRSFFAHIFAHIFALVFFAHIFTRILRTHFEFTGLSSGAKLATSMAQYALGFGRSAINDYFTK